jgi:phage terminase large subunit
MTTKKNLEIRVPHKFVNLTKDARYYVFYGGRGSGKSHSVARYLVARALTEPIRILCAREFQNSITDSVHALLADVIGSLGLSEHFDIKNNTIEGPAGSCFIFKGLAHNIEAIKSTEGIDIVWIEEAERVSQKSWDILIPTIRKPGSKIIVTFNPAFETDPTYQRFIIHPPPDSLVQKVNYFDNPHFPDVLRREMEHAKKVDYNKYLHTWEGNTLTYSDAQVFKDKYVVDEFESRPDEHKRLGADWGFARDATTLISSFVRDGNLYIEYEAYGHGIELTDLATFFRKVPGAERNKIYADSARPETISYMKNQGWNIEAAPKWSGSIEDGIEYMRSFKRIIIHPRCKNVINEFNSYSYKVDKKTDEILPIVMDDKNHTIDAIRYSLSNLIKRKVTIYDEGFF